MRALRCRWQIWLWMAALWAGAHAAAAQAQAPWTSPAFSAPAGELLEAAKAATTGETADVVVLYEAGHHTLDEQGRDSYAWRLVYRVQNARGVEAWATAQARWEPWHQERPQVRARVITAEGREHWLDPKTIGEYPLYEGQPATFSDGRVLRGPLPAVAAEAVVEMEVVVRDTAPLFEAGVVRYYHFGGSAPTLGGRLVVEAPKSLPLQQAVRLLRGVEPRREEAEGRIQWTYEVGRVEALPGIDSSVVPELAQTPHVAFSTGKSWEAVAAAYARVVDAQIATSDSEKEIARETTRGAKTQEEKVARLLERLRRDVRYAAVEFGDAAIVPRAPAETLQRKYGDCKDQATLLVALLRAAGIPAHIALLYAESGPGPERGLPGLGVFNHTIVYIPGTPPMWVDTTHEFARPNQLPPDDQGRLALIAAPGTKELILTPASEPGDNLVVETREFFLSDEGPARVVETSVAHGTAELQFRANYAYATQEQINEWVKSYTANAYLSEEVTNLEFTDPHDLSQPFRLRFEVKGAKRGWTDSGEAGAAILPASLLERLPESWRRAEEGEEDNQGVGPKPEWAELLAQADRVLAEPFVTEWNYRVVPPAGYRPRPLPASETQSLGPVTLTKAFQQTEDAVVTAKLRLDTGKRRFQAAEIRQLRQEAEKLTQAEAVRVWFENVGEAHLQAGRVREALAEFRRLSGLHPGEALHRAQIANALLAGGLGEAARAEARRAIELEPESAVGHRTLAWVLQHDLIGRRFGKGFDHPGAVAAYRRALELNAEDRVARVDLAILLEHNGVGMRYATGAQLDEAIAEYKKIGELEPSHPLFNNLPIALFWGQRLDELKEYLKSHHFPAPLHYIYLAAVAAEQGAPAAQREGATLLPSPEARRQAFLNAAQQLISLRKYFEAAELLTAGAPSAENPTAILQRVALMRRVRRFEDLPTPADDPRSVWPRFFRDIVEGRPTSELLKYFARDMVGQPSEKSLRELESVGSKLRQLSSRQGIRAETLLDLAFSLMQMNVDGEGATCCRLRYQGDLPGTSDQTLYVVKEEGEYRIVGIGGSLASVGRHALELGEAGELAAARQWLDWARDERPLGGGDDPLSGSVFARFWTRGGAAGLEQVRTAAAVLMAEEKETAAEAIPRLVEARARTGSESERVHLDRSLALAYDHLDRNEEALEAVKRVTAAEPTSESAYLVLTGQMLKLKRWEEAEQSARERLARLPDDEAALRMQAHLAQRRGDYAAATRVHQQLVERGKAKAGDYNEMAWQSLFEGEVTEAALELGTRAARMTENNNPAILHTLACLFAETGQTTEARQVALHAMDVAGLEEPNPIFWFIFARIAEQFGENQAAAEAYRKAIPEEAEADPFLATSELARRRLAALGGGGESKPVGAGKPR